MPSNGQLVEKRGAGASRQQLLRLVDELPTPSLGDFRAIDPPRPDDLSNYRIASDKSQRDKLVTSGLLALVQRPGPGNWKNGKAPHYIGKIHPNFDGNAHASRTPRLGRPVGSPSKQPLPAFIIADLRTKWEAYYQATRPEVQRRHEQRAQTVEPGAIATRATQLIAEARRVQRTVTSRDAMLAATEELTADFETVMRRTYGDLVVDILGIPGAER